MTDAAMTDASTKDAAVTTDWARLGADTMLVREPDMNPAGKWEYEDGLMLGGMLEIHRLTGDPRYLEYARANLDRFVRPDGSILGYRADEWNLDHVNNGKVALDLYEATGDERYLKAADLLFAQLLGQPRLDAGTFWHKQIYPYQTWLDGLYMGSVFYARYCRLTGRDDLWDDVALQFTTAYALTLEPSGLCAHAYDETRSMPWADPTTGRSPHVWLRALGWFVMAMTDVLEHLPVDLPQRAAVHQQLRSLLTALRSVADERTGLWFQIPDQAGRPLNYLEASGSFMVLAAVAKGLRLGYLDAAEWGAHLERAWAAGVDEFLTVTAEGWVDVNRICQVAGLGGPAQRDGSYGYYMSEPIVANDHKGVGPFLLLAAEMGRRAGSPGHRGRASDSRSTGMPSRTG
ncbi:glycosyl hydrolase family 88 [Xylanimonas cellulosilytica DSM 15894]|uniref:Glycosyl hydrolase family 88 n=1 Tax=Xylanimonas cellulosilytica (strain DSM 15894 / JCM 12276 / CECT 5975 / KCTC 9989 / LMG 20990 / NBRC 107835 / XIL07) TaxID=446471 RepID=D1BWY7_XYLCX|nr:glycoside hydrolase family 88 protein [Xylanimonas cellulosilytica]ACZ31555.1 glycosyl hydrolase family 88 [Xylanimonas cellulosilytica DSM 15894]